MDHVETWMIDYVEDIETKVNSHCERYNLNPISISITYIPSANNFLVGLVVKEGTDND